MEEIGPVMMVLIHAGSMQQIRSLDLNANLHFFLYLKKSPLRKKNVDSILLPSIFVIVTGFPLGLENLDNLENWEGIFQSGKSQGVLNRLEKSGKITQNTGKLREFEINII